MGWRRKGLEGNIHGNSRAKARLDAGLGMRLPVLFFSVLSSSISRRGEGGGVGEPHSETGELLASKGLPAPCFCPGASLPLTPTLSLLQFPPLPPESLYPFLSQTHSGPATAISRRKDAFRAQPFCFLALFSTPSPPVPVTQRPLEICS